jgi:hypothetical protein
MFCFVIFTFGIMLRLSVKPHLITYLFLILLLALLTKIKYFNNSNLLYLIPVIFLIWVNMHMGVLAGIIMLSIFIFSESFRYFFPTRFSPPEIKPLSKRQFLTMLTIFITSILVTFINPHGLKTYSYTYNMLNLKQLEVVYEWLSPFNMTYATKLYNLIHYFYLLGILPVFYYSLRRKDIFPAILYLAFLIHSTRSVRFTTDFLVAGTFFLTLSLDFVVNNFKNKKLVYVIQRGITVKVILCILLIAIILNIPNNRVYSLIGYPRMFGSGIDINNFPVRMFDFIKQNNIADIGERPFNTYEFGGYFIWNFPDKKSFIDSRGLNDDIWEKYVTVLNAVGNYEQIIEESKLDYFVWIIPNINYGMNPEFLNYGILAYLFNSSREWKLIYWDDNSLLFVKNLPKFKDIISKFEYKFITSYNYYYGKNVLDSAVNTNKEEMSKEIERKESEDPNGVITNRFVRAYRNKLK